MDVKVGQMIVLLAADALKTWDGSECPEGWVGAWHSAMVIDLDKERGWPVIDLWGSRAVINPDLIVCHE